MEIGRDAFPKCFEDRWARPVRLAGISRSYTLSIYFPGVEAAALNSKPCHALHFTSMSAPIPYGNLTAISQVQNANTPF